MELANQQRVVITGLGVISSIGIGKKDFSDAIKQSKCGASNLDIIDTTGFETHRGCEVKNFNPQSWINNLNIDGVGRASQFAIAASKLAISDAGLSLRTLRDSNAFICIGTTEGEALSLNQFSEQWVKKETKAISPSLSVKISADKISLNVLKELKIEGEPISISTACAAGNYAIGYAYDQVSKGNF